MDNVDAKPEPAGPGTMRRLTRRPPSRELSDGAKAWLKENQAAIDAFNRWDEEHGSPLDEYRDPDGPL